MTIGRVAGQKPGYGDMDEQSDACLFGPKALDVIFCFVAWRELSSTGDVYYLIEKGAGHSSQKYKLIGGLLTESWCEYW